MIACAFRDIQCMGIGDVFQALELENISCAHISRNALAFIRFSMNVG